MSDYNHVGLIGRLTRDPEVTRTKNDKLIARVSIANTTGFGDYEKTHFFNCTVWGKSAEYCESYLEKGDLVSVGGQLEIDTWEQDGQKRSAPKINVREINRLRKKGDGTKSDGQKAVEETFVNPFSEEETPF